MKGSSIVKEVASAFIHSIICGIDTNYSATMIIFAALISGFVRQSLWSVRIMYEVGNTKFHGAEQALDTFKTLFPVLLIVI